MARRSDHTREEIKQMAISAAEQILEQHGNSALTARKITAEIGYTVGTLYLVFANISDLVLHVNARSLDQLTDSMHANTSVAAGPEQCISDYGHAYLTYAQNQPHRWQQIFAHHMPEGETIPSWYQVKIDGLFTLVEAQVQRLDPQRPALEVTLAARTLWSSIHGITTLALRNKLFLDGRSPEHLMVQSIIEHYLQGYQANPTAQG